MTAIDDGGPSRDQLATEIMFMALDKDWGLFRDPIFLAAQAYRVSDAMLAARKDT